jgi:hypothetical protein
LLRLEKKLQSSVEKYRLEQEETGLRVDGIPRLAVASKA